MMRVDWHWVFFIFVAALRMTGEAGAVVGYLALAGYVLIWPKRGISALVMAWWLSVLNPGLVSQSGFSAIGRFLVLGACAASLALRSPAWRGAPLPGGVVVLGGILLVLLLHSVLFSHAMDVSILKSVVWFLACAVTYSIWKSMKDEERQQGIDDLFRVLMVTLVLSAPLVFTNAGYFLNGVGFQGVLNQPQVLGLVAAAVSVRYFLNLVCYRNSDHFWSDALVLAMSVAFVLLSGARTAGMACFASILLVLLVSILSARRKWKLQGLKSRKFMLFLTIVLAALLINISTIQAVLEGYLSKRGFEGSLASAYAMSRGRLVDNMLENIDRYSIYGIGFGVSSNEYDRIVVRDPFLGLPISAPTEKGVLPLAILEELGVLGAMILYLISALLIKAFVNGPFTFAMAVFVVATNFAEATLMSPGGFGIVAISLMSWAYFGSNESSRRANVKGCDLTLRLR